MHELSVTSCDSIFKNMLFTRKIDITEEDYADYTSSLKSADDHENGAAILSKIILLVLDDEIKEFEE